MKIKSNILVWMMEDRDERGGARGAPMTLSYLSKHLNGLWKESWVVYRHNGGPERIYVTDKEALLLWLYHHEVMNEEEYGLWVNKITLDMAGG